MTAAFTCRLLQILNLIKLALSQDLPDVGQVGQVGIMQRVVIFEIFAVPVLNDPLLEDGRRVALAGVGNEEEVGHFTDQLGLLAADGSRENRLLLVGLDERTPLEEEDHVANNEVFLAEVRRPVKYAHRSWLVIPSRSKFFCTLFREEHLELACRIRLFQSGEVLDFIELGLLHI